VWLEFLAAPVNYDTIRFFILLLRSDGTKSNAPVN
jgi:hypothetical protein